MRRHVVVVLDDEVSGSASCWLSCLCSRSPRLRVVEHRRLQSPSRQRAAPTQQLTPNGFEPTVDSDELIHSIGTVGITRRRSENRTVTVGATARHFTRRSRSLPPLEGRARSSAPTASWAFRESQPVHVIHAHLEE